MRKQQPFDKRFRRPKRQSDMHANEPSATPPEFAVRLREFHKLVREALEHRESLSADEQIALANLISGMQDLLRE